MATNIPAGTFRRVFGVRTKGPSYRAGQFICWRNASESRGSDVDSTVTMPYGCIVPSRSRGGASTTPSTEGGGIDTGISTHPRPVTFSMSLPEGTAVPVIVMAVAGSASPACYSIPDVPPRGPSTPPFQIYMPCAGGKVSRLHLEFHTHPLPEERVLGILGTALGEGSATALDTPPINGDRLSYPEILHIYENEDAPYLECRDHKAEGTAPEYKKCVAYILDNCLLCTLCGYIGKTKVCKHATYALQPEMSIKSNVLSKRIFYGETCSWCDRTTH